MLVYMFVLSLKKMVHSRPTAQKFATTTSCCCCCCLRWRH